MDQVGVRRPRRHHLPRCLEGPGPGQAVRDAGHPLFSPLDGRILKTRVGPCFLQRLYAWISAINRRKFSMEAFISWIRASMPTA